MDDDFPLPESAAGEEMMELLWHDGTVVMKRCSGGQGGDAVIPQDQAVQPPPPPQQQSFMHEDETASWLQYALDESTFDRDSYVDLFNVPPPPPNPITAIVPPRSAVEIRPLPSQDPKIPPRLYNFIPFSRMPGSSRIDPMNMPAETTARGLTMTESNETPVVDRNDSSTPVNTEIFTAATRGGRSAVADIESVAGTHQFSLASSGGSGLASLSTSVEPSLTPQTAVTEPAVPDRKRKGREDDYEPHSEELEFEASEEAKKQARGLKRYRSAEVHNLSERKRRDRINEKMKTLQELIPGCNKTDKASMLDDAIEYFKSLQFQVQMLSNMGCGMVPMMYPGLQPYMHPMGMGMNRPVMPYPSLGRPGFPIPAAPFHLPRVPAPDPSRIQADPSDQRILNFVDPYHQYLSLQQAQLLLPQDQAEGQSSGTKPSTSKQNDNPEN